MTVRALVFVLALAGFLFLAPSSGAQTVVEVLPGDRITIECPGTGNSGDRGRNYEMISTGDIQVCFGSTTCYTGGDERPKGNHGVFYIRPNVDIACDGEGTVQFIPIEVKR